MIVSFFPDSVWGCTVKQHQKQKHLLYHKIIYTLISDKYKNRILRKSSFALLYLSYVFIKMLPVTLAIETHTGTKSITSLAAKTRPLPEMVAPPLDEEDDDYFDDYVDEYDIVNNKSAKGMYVGAPCEFTCHAKLHHVYCDPTTNTCSCEKDYVVLIGILKGCAKPKKLGEQCFYDQTCIYNDEHALCVQIVHNAICQCAPGFHSVSYSKPTKRVFCTQDMATITADLPTLFGVTSGIAVLAGLICMVLHLFSKTKYPRPRHFGDANLAPPILFSSDTVGKTVISFQSALERFHRAPLHGSKGVLVSTSRTGAARSAAILLVSCHISAIRNSKSTSTDSQHPSSYLSDDNMTKYLERQLEHQKQLLYLDIPSLRTHNKLFSKFCKATALIGSNHTNINVGRDNGPGTGNAAGSSSAGGSNGQYHGPYHYGTSTNDDSSFDGEDGHGTADPFVNHCYSYDLHDSIELGALPTPASEVANVAQALRSRRPSLASVHSTSSSVRSYSMRRFEQEIQQKELRQEMKRHLARLQEQQQLQKIKPNIIIGDVISCPMNKPILTTPSPMTPNSVDDILPSVDETQEVGTPAPGTFRRMNPRDNGSFSPNLSQRSVSDSTGGCFDGPCSSTELLK
uniref:EB domain-containing protein n=1 Tax=Anopheles epiroticus TaxID=199890 RepID=A0A182P5G6_9DIPT